MSVIVERLMLKATYWADGENARVDLSYIPITTNDAYKEVTLDDYVSTISLRLAELQTGLGGKIVRLAETLLHTIGAPPALDLGGETVAVRVPVLASCSIIAGQPRDLTTADQVVVSTRIPPFTNSSSKYVYVSNLSDATQRLIANILPSLSQLAWDDLRSKVGAAPVNTAPKKKVLVSYRKSGPERIAFATAIAHRLGREGFLPWLDEWEIRAGDSLPREIGDGFKDVYAVIPVLSADYPGGTWAREELETAITKRVQEGIKVIPVLYEKCERPQLLIPLAYVDCSDHNPEIFEAQFSRIIDALNELEMNPYR